MFLRGYVMSLLQAAGVVLLARRSWWACLTGFLISYNWISAARDGVDYRMRGVRTAYALGGCCGTATVLLVAWWLAS